MTEPVAAGERGLGGGARRDRSGEDLFPRRPRRSEQLREQQRRRRRRLTAYAVVMAVLGACIPLLGYVGARAVLDSSDGEVVEPVLDPSQPGYRALVPPSPTLLVFHTDETGALAGAAVLSLTSEGGSGGGVLVIPPAAIADIPDLGEVPIEASFAFSGVDAARSTTEWALHVAVDDVVVLAPADWAELFAPGTTLSLTNPDTLQTEGGVRFPAGRLELAPEDVADYAGFLGPDESRLNRLVRQELVWEAWLDQVAADPDSVSFPGEQERGLARFVPAIASGNHRVETLPVRPTDRDAVGFEVAKDEADALIPRLIPFPAGAASGDRPLVRVLNGVDDRSLALPAARRAVQAGGQVVMIGNADSFGQERTEIVYFDPARREDAEAVAEALGFGTVIKVDEIDESADITVVLGADADL